MKKLENLSNFCGKYMAIIVLAISALALFFPQSSTWIKLTWVNYLLMIVMFGMGLTLKLEDFKLLFVRPKDVIIGCLAQFTIMPLLAYGLGIIFGLETALLAGVVLVGACPGGTSSNVITYLSKGDVALSVGITSVTTLLAPFLTPAITYALLQTTVSVDMMSMFISILQVVIIPITLGFVINKLFSTVTQKIVSVLPLISLVAICLIIAAVVSSNSERILSIGFVVFAVVICHNILGYLCGFGLGRALGLPVEKIKTLSIEVGMQNSGLATSLAATSFSHLAMATVPGAIFSVWHNISGAILANIYTRWKKKGK
ncbi:sodium transporter [Candidatus Epulonipiscioides gigas]|nr:sodium transporter [Epulopiscium sp. SCG-C07WGA-EpuloA2]